MKPSNILENAVSIALILLVTLLVYRGILRQPDGERLYPWASDTLGHVMKAEYLREQMSIGHFYPDLFPGWYVGVQMLRYYPPLPYYLMVGLISVVGNSVAAANWFIALCAAVSGITWLPYRRWVGWLPATMGGLLYLCLPDNVRVALAEGNLPRVLATALLPLAVYCLLCALADRATRWHRLGLALCFALIVLCHAMMAAIYAACCALLGVLCWLGRVTTFKQATLAIASAALGVMLSGWWLLPSLTGGITELDASAMTEALAVFPLTTYLDPSLRMRDPEIIYPGAVLLLTPLALLPIRRGRDGWGVAMTLTGLSGVLISTPGFNSAFNALPMHNLFWPLRFLGIASFLLLMSLAWRARAYRHEWSLAPLVLLVLLGADNVPSLRLVHLRPPHPDVAAAAEELTALPGWREATLDYSRLGSGPSYLFTALGRREQIYGWAYQGARTARSVAAINEGMRRGHSSYVIDRLNLLGVDDVVLLHTPEMDPELPSRLETAGFAPAYRGREVTVYHRDGVARAYRADWRALGIGRGAQNLAYLFPQLVVGSQQEVDGYSLEELTRYDTLFLSGFRWADRGRAEELVRRAAQAGVRVVIDLTGTPNDPMARQPYFMGIWGEMIDLPSDAILVESEGRGQLIGPFDDQFPYWQTHTLQGLDIVTHRGNYLGEEIAAVGYETYDGARVWFVGLNLAYHAALTKDQVAIDLLADLLNLSPGLANAYSSLPLTDYDPSQSGYRFGYALDQGEVIVMPVAHHEGTEVYVDGQRVRAYSFEQLVAFEAPGGHHTVDVRVKRTAVYTLGWVVSVLGALGTLASAVVLDSRPTRVAR